MKCIVVMVMLSLLGGCVGQGHWGAEKGWPGSQQLGATAWQVAKDPQVWVPVLSAGLLIGADVDHKWSQEIADEQKLFGGDGASQSNHLRDIASGAYILTALLAPSETWRDKTRGFAIGASTVVLDGVLNQGLKEVVGRQRPDGSNDFSFPSGHASKAASRTAMAQANLNYIDMPGWSHTLADWSLHTVAVGTGLARVEAEKHHLSDVLVGYALGQYLAKFMYAVFLEAESPAHISFVPAGSGGAFTLTMPLR